MIGTSRRKFFAGCNCCATSFTATGADLGRRSFLLGGAAAFGAAATTIAAPSVRAQAQPPAKTRIDVHHHMVPPAHAEFLAKKNSPAIKWSVQMSLDDMDRSGIQTAMLSQIQPGTWFGDAEESRKMSRVINEFGAKTVQDHPGRFGLFATITPLDVEGSLKEIEYAFDTLKCDGAFMWTNYGDIWVGDRSFDPVYEELNRRKATVFVHVRTANCCGNLKDSLGDGTVEWQTDTTRAIGNTIFGGAQMKFPNINFIWPHGGGTMPYLVRRFIGVGEQPKNKANVTPDGFLAAARKFYYDCAQQMLKPQLYPLKEVVTAERMMFGTDAPYEYAVDVMGEIAKSEIGRAHV